MTSKNNTSGDSDDNDDADDDGEAQSNPWVTNISQDSHKHS